MYATVHIEKVKKNWYKRWWGSLLIFVAVSLALIIALIMVLGILDPPLPEMPGAVLVERSDSYDSVTVANFEKKVEKDIGKDVDIEVSHYSFSGDKKVIERFYANVFSKDGWGFVDNGRGTDKERGTFDWFYYTNGYSGQAVRVEIPVNKTEKVFQVTKYTFW